MDTTKTRSWRRLTEGIAAGEPFEITDDDHRVLRRVIAHFNASDLPGNLRLGSSDGRAAYVEGDWLPGTSAHWSPGLRRPDVGGAIVP